MVVIRKINEVVGLRYGYTVIKLQMSPKEMLQSHMKTLMLHWLLLNGSITRTFMGR